MIAYNPVESFVAFAKSMSTYQESQKIRVSYLHQAKEAGDLLRQSYQDFKASGFCTANPYVVGDRQYTSFSKMLKDFAYVYTTLVGPIPEGLEDFFTESQASKCMTLSKEWDVACEIVDFFHPKNAYRLSKTLEIISWYKQKVAEDKDADRSTFTCEKYWEWLNAKREAAREAKAERDKQEHELRMSYSQLQAENEQLKAKLNQVVTEDDYEKIMSYWRSASAELEKKDAQIAKLESDLAELDRKLAALSPKPFTPPTFNQPSRTPVFS